MKVMVMKANGRIKVNDVEQNWTKLSQSGRSFVSKWSIDDDSGRFSEPMWTFIFFSSPLNFKGRTFQVYWTVHFGSFGPSKIEFLAKSTRNTHTISKIVKTSQKLALYICNKSIRSIFGTWESAIWYVLYLCSISYKYICASNL